MAGQCGRVYRVEPRVVDSACNALRRTTAGWLVPETVVEAGPGLAVTPPADGACPQVWRITVDAAWAQARWNQPNATHPLTGADRAYEQITEVPAITIPRDGVWNVSYSARTVATKPGGGGGGPHVTTALFANGALMPLTEAIGGLSTASADGQTGVQGQAGQTFVHRFDAGDVVTLHAYRLGQNGTASVASTSDGRTWVTMHWLGPAGDGAG